MIGKLSGPWPVLFLMLTAMALGAQDYVPPSVLVSHANQVIRIRDLPTRTAARSDSSPALAFALERVFRNPAVCCEKNSALEDVLASIDSRSLKDMSVRLQGRHILSDGRPILITTEYLPSSATNSSQIVASLVSNRPLLMEWNSHLYLLYGAVFDEILYSNGVRDYVIHKLLLSDSESVDPGREVVFNRDRDDWSKVQGLLLVKAELQQP
jgi:hypothetical protein